MSPYKEKCKAIQDFIIPHDSTGILRFLGMARYYQRFAPKLAEISQPLTKLLRKEYVNIQDHLNQEQDEAIKKSRISSMKPKTVIHYNPAKPTLLTTEATDNAMSSTLGHVVGTKQYPISYASKTLD